MSATNFNTKNATYRQLMGNGLTYTIPRFQRDYSWGDEEWEDLWTDLIGAIKPDGEPAHYMGYLVLQTRDDKFFDVIDGQQRLTTLSLIVLAALKNLQQLISQDVDPENNQRRLEQIRQTYIGFLDPVSLVPRSKLSLNRNNDNYYQTYLVPLIETLPQRGIRASEALLRKAFAWFERRVADYVATDAEKGKSLAQFVESMSDKLFFTVITVTDELNAYKVFETLNARGVRLSSTDLLKNYLFSVLHRETQHEYEMNVLENRWEAIVGRLGSESFPDFLRIHWNSRQPLVRQTELFKTIRIKVKTREEAFQLLRALESDLETYLFITQPARFDQGSQLQDNLQTLALFNVTQPFTLLLAVKRLPSLTEQDWQMIVRACVIVAFRYNIIGSLSPSEQESVFNRIAVDITKGTITATNQVITALAPIYPSDATFKAAFAEKSIRTTNTRKKRVVRYILCRLEQHVSGGEVSEFESDVYTVEHILPQNPGEGWDHFRDETVEAFVFRLGNLTLMRTAENREEGNAPYGQKRLAYGQSQFAISRKLAEDNAEWTPERISARQNWMANQAAAIWRIAQLS
ncbi:MAG: DUF262 domain-containing protein [Gloeomargaritaceae cyanobacterium C42_A2020_066]|nr:DUF262 domain-containing protein [Gloeomargaritaceae cyanobacterium C42_A2020_066]